MLSKVKILFALLLSTATVGTVHTFSFQHDLAELTTRVSIAIRSVFDKKYTAEAFLLAVAQENVDKAEQLIRWGGADPNFQYSLIPNIFCYGLFDNCYRFSENFLCELGELQNKNLTPLTTACIKQNHKMVTLLLTYGADPNSTDAEGRLPLALAIQNNYPSIVTTLLTHDANTKMIDMNSKLIPDNIKVLLDNHQEAQRQARINAAFEDRTADDFSGRLNPIRWFYWLHKQINKFF